MNKQKQAGQPLVSIQGLEQYGKRGWTWTQVYQDLLGDRIEQICRTNKDGDGLWFWRKASAAWYEDGTAAEEWRQTLGTCQFSLDRGRRNAYQQIRRLVINELIGVRYYD